MNEKTEHEWTDRLSGFLDGDLSDTEHERMAEHLATCGPCRSTLEELRHVVARAGTLPAPRPKRDLWPGIAAAIQAPVETPEAQVIALPSARWSEGEGAIRSISLSFPQLAAAAVVLMLISATLAYGVRPGGAVPDVGAVSLVAPFEITAAAALPEPPPALSAELASLEEVVREGGASLDPETLSLIRKNLEVIERAIQDSRQALVDDPANGFLIEHLERSYERKLDLLREAAQIVNWAS